MNLCQTQQVYLTFVKSIENEQENISNLLKHISGDTTLSITKLNALIFDMMYFAYLTFDNSVYEGLIKGAGKKIIQEDSVSICYFFNL